MSVLLYCLLQQGRILVDAPDLNETQSIEAFLESRLIRAFECYGLVERKVPVLRPSLDVGEVSVDELAVEACALDAGTGKRYRPNRLIVIVVVEKDKRPVLSKAFVCRF